MRLLPMWWGILSPAVLYTAALALLNAIAAQLTDASSLLCPVLLLPPVLFFCRNLRREKVQRRVGMILQWAAVTALLVLANGLLFPRAVPWPEELLTLAVISSALCAPVCEELIYRGLILDRAGKALGSTAAVILSAVLFGVAHTGPAAIPAAVLAGLVLGWMRIHFHTLSAPIATHIILNLAAFF